MISLDKVEAIGNTPIPQYVTEFKSYLGLLTYYGKFIPAHPCTILGKDVCWKWKAKQAVQQVQAIVDIVTAISPLGPQMPACDTSIYETGAVLSHQLDNGLEKVCITHPQSGFSQLEKEGLACVFGEEVLLILIWASISNYYTDYLENINLLHRAHLPELEDGYCV